MTVEVGDKEGEEDVNGEEAIDNVVYYEKSILFIRQKCELKGANPGRVNDKNNQKHLPSPGH